METMEFMRGDGANHTFAILADAWTAGGHLFFSAKPAIDDDATDAAAVVKGDWGDGTVSDVTINGLAYKQYACHFPASATNSVASNGADELELLGEFEWVPSGADPITFPAAGEDRIPVKLYFDVNRRIA